MSLVDTPLVPDMKMGFYKPVLPPTANMLSVAGIPGQKLGQFAALAATIKTTSKTTSKQPLTTWQLRKRNSAVARASITSKCYGRTLKRDLWVQATS